MEYKSLKSLNNQFGISETSEIINFKTNRIVTPYIGIDLYEHVVLNMKGKKYRKRVHRLMAEAYFNDTKYIDHIDGNRANNHISNLQPITNSANVKKGYEQNKYVNPHNGRGIWIIAEDKETLEQTRYKSLRSCERATGIDRHRIKTFLEGTRNNHTKYNFYYDE